MQGFFCIKRDFKLFGIEPGEKIVVKKTTPAKVAIIPKTKPTSFFLIIKVPLFYFMYIILCGQVKFDWYN